MIEIKNLSKKFQNQVVLEKVNLKLPNRGLIALTGASGEGKSTLLNILSMLDLDYEGELYIDERNYRSIQDLEQFRFNNFGFVFQNYSLFNLMSIKDNILLNDKDELSSQIKLKNVLEKVAIELDVNKLVNTLSGGEKQRIAIARALYLEPRILFCDEPTGALDEDNKKNIMELLKKISKDILVVIVSHEQDLIELYADSIYQIENHQLIKKYMMMDNNESVKITHKDNSLRLSNMFHYVKTNLKNKKYRTTIATSSIASGLICIGIALVLTSIVGDNIKNSLSSLMDNKSFVIQNKEKEEALNEVYSAPEPNLLEMMSSYPKYIHGIGRYYISNFEEQFPQANYCSFVSGRYHVSFSELSIRSINEYAWCEDYDTMYPYNCYNLKDDEVVISLREKDVKRINRALYLKDDKVETLSSYLLMNELNFVFYFQNDEWSYKDEVFLRCKAFVIDDNIGLIHSSHNWNEYILEKIMHFKVTDDLVASNAIPWTFKKVYFLKTHFAMQYETAKLLMNDKRFQIFRFGFVDEFEKNLKRKDRIYVITHKNNGVSLSFLNEIMIDEELSSYTLSVPETYLVLPGLMISGFSRPCFISSKKDDLLKINDLYTISETDINKTPLYQDELNIVYGGLADITNKDNLKYQPQEDINNIYGRKANGYEEIVISSKIARQLFPNMELKNVLNSKINFMINKSSLYDGSNYYNDFNLCELNIVGIVIEEEKNVIYHDNQWNIFFFAQYLDFSLPDLKIDGALFHFDKNIDERLLKNLSLKYDKYQFLNSTLDISSSIDRVVYYIDLGLIAFSLIAIFSSILMTILVIYLFIVENRREIGLLKALGIKKISIRLLFILFSLVLSLIAFFYSSIILFINEGVICYALSSSLKYFSLKAYFKALGFMNSIIFSLALIIGGISSLKALKYDPIKVLKEK